MQICEKEKCVGCFSCVNSCPKGCIKMSENEIGHIYPEIDESLCVECGICKNVCPVNSQPHFGTLNKAYAAYTKDKDEHKTSTSGGAAAAFSKNVISKGGVVYGSSSKVNNGVSHIRVDNMGDLALLKGSKYVQSHINDCYKQAKDDLVSGKEVLFTGTPCQIAGLKAYLKKDYDNLITVDLICHGTPPQKLLFEHLKNYNTKGNLLSFRQTDGFFLRVKNPESGEMIYDKTANLDLYFLGFNKNLFFRDCCYSCDYAKSERCSDITIGDFWGLGKKEPYTGETKNGISVVIPNTKKGELFWESVKDEFVSYERPFLEAVEGNFNMRKPSIPHANKNVFIKEYKKHGFKRAAKKALSKDILKYRIFNMIYKNKPIMAVIKKLKG